MTEPTTAAGPMSESERVLRDLLDVLLKEADPDREWERLLDIALAEARQQDGSALRRAVATFLKRWDDPEVYHRLPAVDDLRAALAALPPSAPPALDVELIERVLFAVFPSDDATTSLIFEALARLQEQDR